MKYSLFLAAFTLFFAPHLAQAQPAHIILIRHGEKDLENPKDNTLSLAGRARAAALVHYLAESPDLTPLGKIDFVFAQQAVDPAKNSLRPIQTVQPFAAAHPPLVVLTPFVRDDHAKLADLLLNGKDYQGKVVLICWEHEALAALAEDLTANVKPAMKFKWPSGDIYGRTWVLSYQEIGQVTFQDFPQALMFGDTKK